MRCRHLGVEVLSLWALMALTPLGAAECLFGCSSDDPPPTDAGLTDAPGSDGGVRPDAPTGPVDGRCGTAARTYASDESALDAELCASGAATPGSPSFPAEGASSTWDCAGTSGGATATCTAMRSSASIIPADRRIDWSHAGIPGGIPSRTTMCATLAAGATATDINDAIEACDNGVVMLAAGTYDLGSEQILVQRSNVTLRGAGPGLTILEYDGSDTAIELGSGNGGAIVNLVGSYPKDATEITVDADTTVGAGDFIVVQENSPAIVDDPGRDYLCVDRSSTRGYYRAGERCISQIVPVAGRVGRTITLGMPLHFPFDAALDPEAYPWSMTERAGIEELTVERTTPDGGMESDIIESYGCAYCWVRGVQTRLGVGAHIRLQFSYGNELRDNFLDFGHDTWMTFDDATFGDPAFGYDSGKNYGLNVFGTNSDHLIVNNIVHSTRHAMIIEGPASGVVFAYNYAFDGLVYADYDWVTSDMSTHGIHPFMNLFEGNVNERLSFDYTHGSSSHNTAFRNHIYRDSPGKTGGLHAVDLQRSNQYENIVGNVLCDSGCTGTLYCDTRPDRCIFRLGYRSDGDGDTTGVDPRVAATLLAHGNFDYVTGATGWDDTIPLRSLPPSLFLSGRPAFWPAALAWPAFGPDPTDPDTVRTGEIPAQACWESTVAMGLRFDPGSCY